MAGVLSTIQCSGENRVYDEEAEDGGSAGSAESGSGGGDASGGRVEAPARLGTTGKGGSGGTGPDPSGGSSNTAGGEEGEPEGAPTNPVRFGHRHSALEAAPRPERLRTLKNTSE